MHRRDQQQPEVKYVMLLQKQAIKSLVWQIFTMIGAWLNNVVLLPCWNNTTPHT